MGSAHPRRGHIAPEPPNLEQKKTDSRGRETIGVGQMLSSFAREKAVQKHSTADEIRQVWADIYAELANLIKEENLRQWIAPLVLRSVTETKICLVIEDDFHGKWVEDNYSDLILKAAETVLGRPLTLEVYVTGQLVLPSITDHQAILPNSFARSSLFGVQERGKAGLLVQQREIASWSNTTIRYTGPELDQHHLDVWLQLLRLVDKTELGEPIEFTAYGFLKEMGKADGKRQYEKLNEALTHLKVTAVDVQIGESAYVGGLIERYYRHEGTGRFVVVLDPLIASLFRNNEYSRIDWEQRKRLRGQLAKFLQAYLSSHSTKAGPHFIAVKKLQKLSRSSFGRLTDFRKKLRKACAELADVGALQEWWIDDNDVAHFVRAPTVKALEEKK